MNQQVEKFVLSPVVRNAPVRREVSLCPDGKVAIRTTCTKCGKAFNIKMDRDRFLICLTADHSASYAYAFWDGLTWKWYREEKDGTVVCDDLTFLPTQCGGCGYKIRYDGIEWCRWSMAYNMGNGFRQMESYFARNLRSVSEEQQGEEDYGRDFNAREMEIALKSGNQVEMSVKCSGYHCDKIVTSILDSHEFIAILSNEIGVADAMRLWDMIKKSPVKGNFYCLSRCVEGICSGCRQNKDDYSCYLGDLWSSAHLIKETMHKNADGTFDFERKCPRCGQSYKIRLLMSRFLEWECWLEQFTFEWQWLHAYDYDDESRYYAKEFWKELSYDEVCRFFEGSICGKCAAEIYGRPTSCLGDATDDDDLDDDLVDINDLLSSD